MHLGGDSVLILDPSLINQTCNSGKSCNFSPFQPFSLLKLNSSFFDFHRPGMQKTSQKTSNEFSLNGVERGQLSVDSPQKNRGSRAIYVS